MSDILKKVKYKTDEKVLLCGDFNVDSLKYKYKRPVTSFIKNKTFSTGKEDLDNEYEYLIAALSKNNFKIRDCYFVIYMI